MFVDTNPKHERIAVLKESIELKDIDVNDTNVFRNSLIDRYEHRPNELQSLSLDEFAATYVTKYQHKDADTANNDVFPTTETDSEPKKITLTNGCGKMNKRRKQAVSSSKVSVILNWFRAKLMHYYPWYNETTDLLGGYSTYEEHYNYVKHIVTANELKYMLADIYSLVIDENNIPEHAWNQIAPNTESNQAQSFADGLEPLTEISQKDIDHNANLFT